MSIEDLVPIEVWDRYGKKMMEAIENPRSLGRFSQNERAMRSVAGQGGEVLEGNAVKLYWLVDEADGMIVDAKFQIFGISALIAAAEAACTILVGKSYEQAKRVTAELIDRQLRDRPDEPAFSEETISCLNLVLDAIDDAAEKCTDIPLSQTYQSPIPAYEEKGGYPGWLELSYEKKIEVIENVLSEEVRPYIELDEGGVQVLELVDNKELLISYQGTCTSCFSAVGATLSTIQQILQAKVHSELVVVPNMDELHF
ncbi:MAG: iron-sulfur cluster assembly scaffold protein [Chlamydiales bacterium]